jgi:hypothetical protein
MSEYTFLPWMRRGLANELKDPAGAGSSRAKLEVSITVGADVPGPAEAPNVKAIKIVGPGDILGMNPRQVIRTEPRAGTSDFEPNYLAAVDFYDEDFLWRYSPFPVQPGHRLPPWIVLIILKDEEFERVTTSGRLSPSIKLTAKAQKQDIFPPINQEFAWAHVHLNASIGDDTKPDTVRLKTLLDQNPDAAYSRLICPRKLDENTGYTGFIVPALDVGRRAGLGDVIADNEDGSIRSWAGASIEFPVYFEWRFRTGVSGDFEQLVRALVPRDMDPLVGVRDMDISKPGFGVAGVTNSPDGLVSLEGALLAPTSKRRGLSADSNFAPQIADVINLPADVQDASGSPLIGAGDPIVAPPIYGGWQAGVDRVELTTVDPGWVPAINLDPRYRAAAGLGARVVRKYQEQYMRSAWEQIGDVLTINAIIRRGQLTTKAATASYGKTFLSLNAEYATALSSPVFSKIMGSPMTLRALVAASRLPAATLSPAFRKLMRPRGRLVRAMLPADAQQTALSTVIQGVNDGSLSASPPPPPPNGATLESVTAATQPAVSPWLRWILHNAWWIVILLLLLVLALWLLINPVLALTVGVIAGAILAFAYKAAVQQQALSSAGGLLGPASQTPEATAAIPARPAFVFTPAPGDPLLTVPLSPPPPPGADSNDAADMRRALIDYHVALSAFVPLPPPKQALDIAHVHTTALAALEPHLAISSRFAPLLRVGDLDAVAFQNERYTGYGVGGSAPKLRVFREIMNYPDIKDATYLPLSDISDEYFVPNLGLVPNNTISLMKINQEFIESFFAGLNHEFARELLWNEYPTDMQGSYFRQFWDVSRVPRLPRETDKDYTERLKDVVRLHQWDRKSALGSHSQRARPGAKSQVILVIRGDLLKRYPNTAIYAQQATWSIDPKRQNRLALSDESGDLVKDASDPRFRFPLYHAFVAPDIYFIGFDLTLEEVKGDPKLEETAQARATISQKDLGWFFVLQEIVGEPRFAMDVAAPTEPAPTPSWNDLSWVDVDLRGGQSIDLNVKLVGTAPKSRPGGTWGDNAADMANILYQEPVMVGIHGREMLKDLVPPT